MILSARFLTNVGSVNDFQYAQQAEFVEGDTFDIYFQLIDAAAERTEDGFKPSGRRYMPAAGALLTATVDNIDAARQISRLCTQPFPQDPSIWKMSVLSTDDIKGTSNLKLTLNESGVMKRGLVKVGLRAYPHSNM